MWACDLENTVPTCVKDGFAAGLVFGAIALDHFCSRSGVVCEPARDFGGLGNASEKALVKALGKQRKGFIQWTAHHFPMAGRCVLTRRDLSHATKGTGGGGLRRKTLDPFDRAQTERT